MIHYIRSLQAKEKKVTYSADANTLNPAFGTPGSQISLIVENLSEIEATDASDDDANAPAEGSHDNEEHDHDDHGSH